MTLTDDPRGSLAAPSLQEVAELDAWWRANMYLTVGQIYLRDNALLREPLTADHIKPRLLGHWGTSPGLAFIYAHVSRLIKATGQEAIYLAGPGHGGPALVAASWLEGTYSETYPAITFTSTDVKRDGNDWHITGDLTIKDVTKSVVIPFEQTGSAQDPFGNVRVGFEGETTINRKDWGLTWNAALETGGVLVSEKIKLEFDVSAIRNA